MKRNQHELNVLNTAYKELVFTKAKCKQGNRKLYILVPVYKYTARSKMTWCIDGSYICCTGMLNLFFENE